MIRGNKLFLALPAILLFGWAARSLPVRLEAKPAPVPAQVSARTSGQTSEQTSAQAPSNPLVQFTFGGNAAEIPAQFIDNLVFFPVRVNESAPSLFEVDSTASVSSVDPARAAEIGVPENAPAILNLHGVGIPLASLPQLARKDFAAQMGRAYEGVLGADFLSRVVLEVDYARQTARVFDPRAYQYAGHGTRFGLTFSGGVPVMRARLEAPNGKKLDASFAVDTALEAPIVISESYASSRHFFSSHWKTAQEDFPGIDGGAPAAFGRIQEFDAGSYSVQYPIAVISRGPLPAADVPQIAGAIGAGFLRHFIVTFDFAHQCMFLEPNTKFSEDDEEDKSGITIAAKGPGLKIFEVTEVRTRTPASEAGLRPGDVIAGIDQDAAADMTLYDVRDLLRQTGHKYSLVIVRDGQTLTIPIQMRRLLE
jgi:hypothetical protein